MRGRQPWTRLIDSEKVFSLHGEAISRYGGEASQHEKDGCLDKSLGAAWNAELYTAQPENSLDGLCFAGCLMFYLAKNHCFIDGNKRIAWLAAMQVLLGLHLTLDVDQQEAEEYVLSILNGDVAQATDVSSWMADRLMATDEDSL